MITFNPGDRVICARPHRNMSLKAGTVFSVTADTIKVVLDDWSPFKGSTTLHLDSLDLEGPPQLEDWS